MPQVDLPTFFPSAPRRFSRTVMPATGEPGPASPVQHRPPRRRIRLTASELTNIGFVVAACIGAVVSAVYLFKGTDVLQEVAAWPRELFYGRPARIAQVSLSAKGGSIDRSASDENRDAGDPFSPASRLLNLDPTTNLSHQPNGTPTGTPFSAPSNLSRLNNAVPGGDALSRALMSPASALTGAQSSAVKSAVGAVSPASANAAKAVSGQSKSVGTNVKSATANVPHSQKFSKTSPNRQTTKPQAASQQQRLVSNSTSKLPTRAVGNAMSPVNQNASSAGLRSTAGPQSIGGVGHSLGSAGAGLGLGHGSGGLGGR